MISHQNDECQELPPTEEMPSAQSKEDIEEMYRKHLKAKEHEVSIEELIVDQQVISDGGIYLFGYGSLIWRAGFNHTHKIKGFITGYKVGNLQKMYNEDVEKILATKQRPQRLF